MPTTTPLHDLFISYAEADWGWIASELVPTLEAAGVRWHSEEAFRLGAPRLLEFETALKQSERTLLVVSPAFLAGNIDRFLALLATEYSAFTASWPVIVLVLQTVELPLYLRALSPVDATDAAHRQKALQSLLAELSKPLPVGPDAPPCPYPGMRPYTEAEAGQFYGRESMGRDVVERLRLHPFLAIFGASGSGKSSFVSAGVAPALRKSPHFPKGGWRVLTLRPGPHPIQSLAATLASFVASTGPELATAMAQDPMILARHLQTIAGQDSGNLLLFIDQFEEVFVQCKDAASRLSFFKLLQHVYETRPQHCFLILAVRSDFYGDCQESPLWPYFEASLLNLPPLTQNELRQAIVIPAQAVGVYLEPALIERLLADAAHEKGVLPLLQETLVLLWSQLERQRLLTIADYEDLGRDGRSGLQVALARRADAALANLTNDEQRMIARRIFLRLVEFGDRRANTRRQQPLASLQPENQPPPAFEIVLQQLVNQRLLTVSTDLATGLPMADLAHERLIDAWPRLAEWLETYRPMEDMRRQLVRAAAAWNERQRDPSYLFMGARLQMAEQWVAEWGGELSAPEREFLGVCRDWDRRQRLRRGAGLTAIFVVLALLAGFAGYAAYRAKMRSDAGAELVRLPDGNMTVQQGETGNQVIEIKGLAIEKYEVSNRQFWLCARFGPCGNPQDWANAAKEQPNDPVTNIDLFQAARYCQWLGRRLPTAVEWEYAAIGDHERSWPWGDTSPTRENKLANVRFGVDDAAQIEPVAARPQGATPQGVVNLIGNAMEWTFSCTQPEFCASSALRSPDLIDATAEYVIKGGSFRVAAERVSVQDRLPGRPDARRNDIGFRCAFQHAIPNTIP